MKINLEVFPRPGESQFFGIASGGNVAQAFGTGATERDAALAAVHALYNVYNAVPTTVAHRAEEPGIWLSSSGAGRSLLREAKDNGIWLDIDYIDRFGDRTTRRALPVEMLSGTGSVGVQTEHGYRALRLERIQRVRRAAER